MPQTLLSIIVCTRNRATELVACLRDLVAQASRFADVEIVVVDNGSTDSTSEVVSSLSRELGYDFRYVFEAEAGLCRARNRGAQAARGSVFAYIDDDDLLCADWIESVRAHFLHARSDCLGGKVEATAEEAFPPWFPEGSLWMLGQTQLGETVRPIEYPLHPPGGNFAVARKVFEAVGGFDTRLTLFGDEKDFFRRVSLAGFTIIYDPAIRIIQRIPPHRLTKKALRRKAYLWGRGSAMACMLAVPGSRRRVGKVLEYASRTFYVGCSLAVRRGFGREFTFWHNLGYLVQFAWGPK